MIKNQTSFLAAMQTVLYDGVAPVFCLPADDSPRTGKASAEDFDHFPPRQPYAESGLALELEKLFEKMTFRICSILYRFR